MHGKILMSKQTQLFPVGLFVSFLTVILGIIANCFIKQNKILLAKIIILSIFGTMASFAIHIFSLSSFGSGRLHISIGMTIGYIFIMLYVLSDVLENKTFFSYLLNILLCLWFLTNIFNFMFLTYEHQLANKIDKQKTMEIVKYVQEYEKDNKQKCKKQYHHVRYCGCGIYFCSDIDSDRQPVKPDAGADGTVMYICDFGGIFEPDSRYPWGAEPWSCGIYVCRCICQCLLFTLC